MLNFAGTQSSNLKMSVSEYFSLESR